MVAERSHECVNMIWHDNEFIQSIALAIEVPQGIFNDSPQSRPLTNARAVIFDLANAEIERENSPNIHVVVPRSAVRGCCAAIPFALQAIDQVSLVAGSLPSETSRSTSCLPGASAVSFPRGAQLTQRHRMHEIK